MCLLSQEINSKSVFHCLCLKFWADALGPLKGPARLQFHAQVRRRTEDEELAFPSDGLTGVVQSYWKSDINHENINTCKSHKPCYTKKRSQCPFSGFSEHSTIKTCARKSFKHSGGLFKSIWSSRCGVCIRRKVYWLKIAWLSENIWTFWLLHQLYG